MALPGLLASPYILLRLVCFRFNGVGGYGGSVYVRPVPGLNFKKLFEAFPVAKVKADQGQPSAQVRLVGRNAPDKVLSAFLTSACLCHSPMLLQVIDVPMGVECVDEEERLLARCNQPRRRYLIASGGVGGYRDNKYMWDLLDTSLVIPTHSPALCFSGQKGEELTVDIHLKLRPNVGILGFPNAGKSTLLKALVPERRVRIASYPFTTLEPQMCYLKYPEQVGRLLPSNESNWSNTPQFKEQIHEEQVDGDESRRYQPPPFTLSIADLPGIVEGAHMNRGMGCKFLKHLEFSDIIAMVVDVHGFQYAPSLEHPYRSI